MASHSSLVSGTFWFASASLLSKGASFIAQIVLGWILLAEDFGAYAIALSLAAFVAGFRNGGTDYYLVQAGNNASELYEEVNTFSLVFNTLTCGFLILMGYVASELYEEPILFPMLALMGLALPFVGVATVMRLKISILGRYKSLSVVTLTSDSARQFSSIGFALLGFGALSFALPVLLEPIVMGVAAYLVLKNVPGFRRLSRRSVYELLASCKWLMMSNFAIAMTLTGSYLVLSFYVEQKQLGLFFFAMQLVSSIAIPITNSINNVLFPHLANMNDKEERMKVVSRGLLLSTVIASLISITLFAFVQIFIQVLWQGKWDESLPFATLLSLIPLSLITNAMLFSLMSVDALWRKRFYCIILAASFDMVLVAIGASIGGAESAAGYLVVAKLLFSAGLLVYYMHWIAGFIVPKTLRVSSIFILACVSFSICTYFKSEALANVLIAAVCGIVVLIFGLYLEKINRNEVDSLRVQEI